MATYHNVRYFAKSLHGHDNELAQHYSYTVTSVCLHSQSRRDVICGDARRMEVRVLAIGTILRSLTYGNDEIEYYFVCLFCSTTKYVRVQKNKVKYILGLILNPSRKKVNNLRQIQI